MACMTYSGILLGAEDSCSSVSLNSGSTFQIAHADFLTVPCKTGNSITPSQSWNIGNARAFGGPRPAANS